MVPDNSPSFFISPHIDDVVFSCGGTLSRRAGQGPVRVLNIFTDYGKRTRIRKEEEKRAAGQLGFDFTFLDFPDLARRDRGSFLLHRMFRPFDPVLDGRWVEEICLGVQEALSGSPECRIYFPLGVGSHLDHQLCFQAGKRIAQSHPVHFYEDVPYSLIPGLLSRRLAYLSGAEHIEPSGDTRSAAQYLASRPPCHRFPGTWVRPLLRLYYRSHFNGRNLRKSGPHVPPSLGPLTPQYVCIDGHLETKVEAMWSYRSQIGDFFYSKEEAREALSHFYRGPAGLAGELFERFWKMA